MSFNDDPSRRSQGVRNHTHRVGSSIDHFGSQQIYSDMAPPNPLDLRGAPGSISPRAELSLLLEWLIIDPISDLIPDITPPTSTFRFWMLLHSAHTVFRTPWQIYDPRYVNENLDWTLCSLTTTCVLALACPPERLAAALRFGPSCDDVSLQAYICGNADVVHSRFVDCFRWMPDVPWMPEHIRPIQSVRDKYQQAKSRAIHRGETTVIGVKLEHPNLEQPLATFLVLIHSFSMVIAPDGLVVYNSWRRSQHIQRWMGTFRMLVKPWDEADRWIDDWEIIVRSDNFMNFSATMCEELFGPWGASTVNSYWPWRPWVETFVIENVTWRELRKFDGPSNWGPVRESYWQEYYSFLSRGSPFA